MTHDIGTRIQGVLWKEPILLPPIPNILGKKTHGELKSIERWLTVISNLINEAERISQGGSSPTSATITEKIDIFLYKCCKKGNKMRAPKPKLYSAFISWAEKTYGYILDISRIKFHEYMRSLGYEEFTGKTSYYKGIELNS